MDGQRRRNHLLATVQSPNDTRSSDGTATMTPSCRSAAQQRTPASSINIHDVHARPCRPGDRLADEHNIHFTNTNVRTYVLSSTYSSTVRIVVRTGTKHLVVTRPPPLEGSTRVHDILCLGFLLFFWHFFQFLDVVQSIWVARASNHSLNTLSNMHACSSKVFSGSGARCGRGPSCWQP